MKKRFSAIVCAIALILLFPFYNIEANAAQTHTSTLDIAQINKNTSGDGYVWANMDDLLTLTDFRLETDDEFGLKLPDNATIVLNGDNYIKASSCAIRCVTSLTIEGNGTLTLVSGDTGILCVSNSTRDTVRFRSGDIKISAESHGVYSEYATVSFSGANTEISGADYAVRGRNVQMTAGNINIEGKIHSATDLTLTAVNLNASADGAVLVADHEIRISGVDMKLGPSLDSLSNAESYSGEAAISTVSNVDATRRGVLLGGSFPVFVDYIVFSLIAIVAVALIAVPIYLKQQKTKKLIAEHEKMLAAKKKR